MQVLQPELKGVVVLVSLTEEDQRPEEVVPGALELEDGERRYRRHRERQHDAPERLEVPGSVELRRFLEVPRDREEVLTHEEEVYRRNEVDHDVAPEASEQAPVHDH